MGPAAMTHRETSLMSDHPNAGVDDLSRLAYPPHLAQVAASGADAADLFALRQQCAQFMRTCALRAPATPATPPSRTDFEAMTTTKGM